MFPVKLLQQKWNPPKDPDVSFEGKTVIVTGATTGGLGYEAGLKFAQKGASKVILTARTIEKGLPAKGSIESTTGKRGVVEIWELEMTSYDSITSFVKKVENLKKVDAVILNAGLIAKDYRDAGHGWETTLQVNVLSTTLLALMLLPKLRSSKTPKSTAVLELVSSGLYKEVIIPDEALDAPLEAANKNVNGYHFQAQYNMSKLFVQCMTKQLGKITQPEGAAEPSVIVLSTCPGACKSSLARELMANPIVRILGGIFLSLFFRTTEEGSRTFVSATVQGPQMNGKTWKDDKMLP